MQEKIDIQESIHNSNIFLFPQILSIEQQKHKLRCPNHNQANSICISKECLIPGLMCLETKCECRRIHLKCHHILLDRVLQSIERHQKQIPQKIKQTYKTIYEIINQMIQKLSKLRTKFEKQEQYFGLRQEELKFMDLINDSKIDQINGKIVNSLEKTFDIQIQLSKSTKQDIISDFQSKRKDFDKLCDFIQESYLHTALGSNKVIPINDTLFQESKIVKQKEEKQLLNKWLKQSFEGKEIQSKLLFRASSNNFQAKKFHQYCDGKNDTIVIVQNQFDKVIGGFTPISWHSNKKDEKDLTDKSFMFSLNLKQKYKYVNKNYRSVCCHSEYGPLFGAGDISLYDKCNFNNSSFGNLGNAFNIQINNENKYKTGTQQTKRLFTGNTNNSSNFKVKQYQVYQIKIQ